MRDAVQSWIRLRQAGELDEAIATFQTVTGLSRNSTRVVRPGYLPCQTRPACRGREGAARSGDAAADEPHAWYALGMAHHHLNESERVTEIIQHLHRFDPIHDPTSDPGYRTLRSGLYVADLRSDNLKTVARRLHRLTQIFMRLSAVIAFPRWVMGSL